MQQGFVRLMKRGIFMLKFSYIREFVTLAETLNFSKTAEMTFITQSALSRHIAELEEEAGAQLFERTTRIVELTPAGEVFCKACRDILHTWNAGKESAAFLAEGKRGMLSLSSPYYWTEDFTEPVVKNFLKHYPECDVRILSSQPHQGHEELMENKVDIFISYFENEIDASVRRVPFAKERLCFVCLKEHPLAGRDFLMLKELKDQHFVSLGYGSQNYRNHSLLITDLLALRGIHPASISYTQQIDTVGLTLQQTGYVSILPYGTRHMDRSYLRFIPLMDDDCSMQMCLYYRLENRNVLLPQFVQEAKRTFSL